MTDYIFEEPQWPIIIFGNGCMARAVHVKEGIVEDDGVITTEIWLKPHSTLMRFYHYTDADLDEYGLLKRRYPSAYIIPLNLDPVINVRMIMCGFDWEDTMMTKQFPNIKTLTSFEKEIEKLRGELASKEEELKISSSRRTEYYTRLAQEIGTVKKLLGRNEPNMDEDMPPQYPPQNYSQ